MEKAIGFPAVVKLRTEPGMQQPSARVLSFCCTPLSL